MQAQPKLNAILLKCESTDQFQGPVCSVNQKSSCGDTPLHMVVHWDDLDAARLLISEGGNVNAQGEREFTPLFYSRSLAMAKLLLDEGADPEIKGDQGQISPDQYIRLIDLPAIANFIALIRLKK